VAGHPGSSGFVVIITNDSGYWVPSTGIRPSNDDAFRIHEGTRLEPGVRDWRELTSSTRSRESGIETTGRYELTWKDYSTLDDTSGGTFRSLVIAVADVL
jgi:hypothetical protein